MFCECCRQKAHISLRSTYSPKHAFQPTFITTASWLCASAVPKWDRAPEEFMISMKNIEVKRAVKCSILYCNTSVGCISSSRISITDQITAAKGARCWRCTGGRAFETCPPWRSTGRCQPGYDVHQLVQECLRLVSRYQKHSTQENMDHWPDSFGGICCQGCILSECVGGAKAAEASALAFAEKVHEMQLTNCSTLQSPMLRFQTISTTRSPGWHPNQSHVIPWTVFGIYLHYLCLYGSFQTEKTSLVEHGCCFSVIHHSMTSLKCYGFLGKPAGIPIRARLTHQQEIDNWCTVHLKGKKSMDFKIPQRSEVDE